MNEGLLPDPENFARHLNVLIEKHVIPLLQVIENGEFKHMGRKGVKNVHVGHEGVNERGENIFILGIVLAPGHFLNAHILVQEAKSQSGLMVWPDLRWYGRDAGVLRLTLYVPGQSPVEKEK